MLIVALPLRPFAIMSLIAHLIAGARYLISFLFVTAAFIPIIVIFLATPVENCKSGTEQCSGVAMSSNSQLAI